MPGGIFLLSYSSLSFCCAARLSPFRARKRGEERQEFWHRWLFFCGTPTTSQPPPENLLLSSSKVRTTLNESLKVGTRAGPSFFWGGKFWSNCLQNRSKNRFYSPFHPDCCQKAFFLLVGHTIVRISFSLPFPPVLRPYLRRSARWARPAPSGC